jgi:hypothetical protein
MAAEVDQDCFSRLDGIHVSLKPFKADMPGILSPDLLDIPSIAIHEQNIEVFEAPACLAGRRKWVENPIVLVVQIPDQPSTALVKDRADYS